MTNVHIFGQSQDNYLYSVNLSDLTIVSNHAQLLYSPRLDANKDILTRAGTIQSLSVHYRYRNQPIRIDTVIMPYLYR